MNEPLTCGRLRALVTRHGLLASSPVVLRMKDGTQLRFVEDEVVADIETDGDGKERLTALPALLITVERVYP